MLEQENTFNEIKKLRKSGKYNDILKICEQFSKYKPIQLQRKKF